MATATEAPASTTAEGPTSHTQNQASPSVYQLMSLVMRDVRNVGKDGRNESQSYNFRGVDDAIGALAQPLRDHGVFMTPEVLDFKTEVRGRQNAVLMRIAFHFYGPAGDHVTAITLGEGSDFADKAANKAMSAALKYALIHTFMIPVDAKSLDDGDRDHPEGRRSPADGYMERLRKPAVWHNVKALEVMHTEAKADGLLGATVYAPGGEEMTLGELIVSRGTTLRREAAEQEERKAKAAAAVSKQMAAEHGTPAVHVDPASFRPHPDGQDFANQAALATNREAVESLRPLAESQGIANSGVLAPDSGKPDVLSAYLERRSAELTASQSDDAAAGAGQPSEHLAKLLRQATDCWKSPGVLGQIRADGESNGVLDEEFTAKDGSLTTLRKVLDDRLAELQQQRSAA